nr:unnamed protein product [Spirometra erinaceieuropaei]
MDNLTALSQEMWRQGEVPQDFKDATIVHLYKRKGNRQVCDNHRGTSLLNIAENIFARVLLNRLNNHLDQGLLPESQCGILRHRGTTGMIFEARQLQKKCQEMRTHLYSSFVDLTKAYNTVNREELWKLMQKFGCPERPTQMVRQLHDGMMARFTDNGATSEAFAVTNGVKQGCVLAPTLFSLMFSAMPIMDAYRDERPGIRIAYRTRLQVNTATWEELALDRPTWWRTVKTGAAIYEANRIAAAKAKREARKSQLRPVRNAATQPLPTCPRCQRTFWARIGLVGHLRINCASRTAPPIVPPPASSSPPPPTNSDNSSEPSFPSSSSNSTSPTAPTTAAQATATRATTDTTDSSSVDFDDDHRVPHRLHCGSRDGDLRRGL